jgi:hypothetical protein
VSRTKNRNLSIEILVIPCSVRLCPWSPFFSNTSGELPVMYESMRTNTMVEMDTQPTLADTCAGCVDLDVFKRIIA